MGIDHYLYRPYARSIRGIPVHAAISGKKYKRTSIVAARVDGKIIAPMQYSGTMDSALFEAWFENMLLPLLDRNMVIVMNNASFTGLSRKLCKGQLEEQNGANRARRQGVSNAALSTT